MNKLDETEFLNKIHSKTDLSDYIKVIFHDRKIGPLDFFSLANHCSKITQTKIPNFKAFRRFERLWMLLSFELYALRNVDGPMIECGVYRGFSALAINILMNAVKDSEGSGLKNFWLLDSYEGLSEPVEQDFIDHKSQDRSIIKKSPMRQGHFATPLEEVKKHFLDGQNIKFIKGWIPEAFTILPEEEWSFVHIDVDLYKPIQDSLEYFYPRMRKGGVIINDDFGSALFPGAGMAWSEFFEKKNEGYAILDTGQAVFIKK